MGVLFLADLVHSIGSTCAFGVVNADQSDINIVKLSGKIIEGMASNALFIHGLRIDDALVLFHGPSATVLIGPVHVFTSNMEKVKMGRGCCV